MQIESPCLALLAVVHETAVEAALHLYDKMVVEGVLPSYALRRGVVVSIAEVVHFLPGGTDAPGLKSLGLRKWSITVESGEVVARGSVPLDLNTRRVVAKLAEAFSSGRDSSARDHFVAEVVAWASLAEGGLLNFHPTRTTVLKLRDDGSGG